MTITELATLKLYNPYNATTHGIDGIFLGATAAQTKWSSQPVYLFSDHEDPQLQRIIYLISGWESVSAHQEWIASDENQSWLKALEDYVDEVQLKHLDFAFEKEALDVGCVVYRNFKTKNDGDTEGDGAEWSAEGINLEAPDTGLHRLTAYPGVRYPDLEAILGEPAEGETRIALKRIWVPVEGDSNKR